MSLFEDWTRCRHLLLPAIERTNGTHTEDDVLAGIVVQGFKLWFTDKSACITEFINYPRMKALNIFLVGGDLEDIVKREPDFQEWARQHGCQRIQCGGREGWKRSLPGYTAGGQFIYRDI